MANGHGGARPGAGRKPDIVRNELMKLLDEGVPYEDRLTILRGQAEIALRGNTKAAQLILNYCYGKPVSRHEMAGDGDGANMPLKILVEYADLAAKAGMSDGDEGDE